MIENVYSWADIGYLLIGLGAAYEALDVAVTVAGSGGDYLWLKRSDKIAKENPDLKAILPTKEMVETLNLRLGQGDLPFYLKFPIFNYFNRKIEDFIKNCDWVYEGTPLSEYYFPDAPK